MAVKWQGKIRSENDLQNLFVRALREAGYIVIEIGRARRAVRCHQCGGYVYPRGWQGNTPGSPDLFLSRPDGLNVWHAVEVKLPKGRIRDEQKHLLLLGKTTIAASPADLEQIIECIEAQDYERLKRLRNSYARNIKGKTGEVSGKDTDASGRANAHRSRTTSPKGNSRPANPARSQDQENTA